MKVLKAIATPFVALWRWIKETAWVQPLLIVGVIFAIIFSIPSITSWVQSWDFGSDSYKWLEDQKLSLEGMTGKNNTGEAHDFFKDFNEANKSWQTNDKTAARQKMNKYTGDGNKMMLYFVQENTTAENVNEASAYLVNEAWNQKIKEKDSTAPNFRYKSIFTDQKIDVDENDHTYETITPYEYLIIDSEFLQFYSALHSAALSSNYYINLSSSSDKTTLESNVDKIDKKDEYSSALPYYVIIDLTDKNTSNNIISNVFFSITGDNKYQRADYIATAWLETEDFKKA